MSRAHGPRERRARLVVMMAAVMASALMLCSHLVAAPTPKILHVNTSDKAFETYFSFLDSGNLPINDLKAESLQVFQSKDKEKALALDNFKLQALKDSDKPAIIMFVIANYRAFNESNTNAFTAVNNCLERSEVRATDAFGVFHYGENQVLVTGSSDTLKDDLSTIEKGDETIPKMFSALKKVGDKFKELDPQGNGRRYLILISDGHGAWEGADQPSSKARKEIRTLKEKFAKSGITPLVIGYSPDGSLGQQALSQLRALATRTNGTYRSAGDSTDVASAVDDACNEIYNSYYMEFTTNDLEPETSYNITLKGKYQGKPFESRPAELVTPDKVPGAAWWKAWWVMALGGGALLLLLILVIVIIASMFRSKDEEEPAQAVPDYGQPAYHESPPEAYSPPVAPRPVFQDAPPPRRFYAKLTGLNGDYADRSLYIVEESTTIGSAEQNTLNIIHSTISKEHAGIRIKDSNRFELHDFKSTNGVFINGKRISKQFLKNGDRIRFGKLEFLFSLT